MRFGVGVQPSSLWTTYFTSSKYVKEFREQHGEPDIVEVRRVFDDIMKARQWEWKLLKRMHVVRRVDFLNRTDKPAPPSRLGSKHSKESRHKMKGPLAEERKRKISETLKGTNQKRWLITTPETTFCIQSLDWIRDNKLGALYNSFRYGHAITRGKLKGWKLEQIR